ncbi:unnamed protein product, partial [Prorocentrum cordatum]
PGPPGVEIRKRKTRTNTNFRRSARIPWICAGPPLPGARSAPCGGARGAATRRSSADRRSPREPSRVYAYVALSSSRGGGGGRGGGGEGGGGGGGGGGLRGGPPSPNGYARSAGTESASRGSKGGGPESSSARRRRQVEESEEDPEVRGSKIEVLWRARAQGAEALHTSGRRLFANFGLEGLSPGPGAVKKRLGMTNRPRGGCGPGKITPSDLWVS